MKYFTLRALICLIIFSNISRLSAQDVYYWNTHEKIILEEDRSSLTVSLSPDIQIEEILNVTHPSIKRIIPNRNDSADRAVVLLRQEWAGKLDQLVDDILLNPIFLHSATWGLKLNGEGIWLSNGILYKEGPGFNEPEFLQILSRYSDYTLTKTEMGYPKIILSDISEILPLSNELFESGIMAWTQPDFIVPARKNSDPLFPDQYFLQNTGQFGGTPGMDMNIVPAWALTLGDENIIVTVLDDGIEAHEDMEDKWGNSRVLPGYSPGDPFVSDGTPQDPSGDVHGQAVAGIIAASHNSLGGRGVAPFIKVQSAVPYKIGDTATVVGNFVDAITWGWKSGGHIINNSWTYYYCGENLFPAVETAIDSALNFGRNGKGVPVLFSAGYNGGGNTCVLYPASLPQVFTLSAINDSGLLSVYSPFGPSIDACMVSSGSVSNITTTDRMGVAGLDSGNYTSGFGGTSSAAAMASGVMALMISADSNLTETQIVNILTTTAFDLGSAGKDDSTGYGRVDAGAALQMVTGTFPVEWESFTGFYKNEKINLQWATSQEINSDYFSIEKRTGGHFQSIGTVAASGNTHSTSKYEFADHYPQSGANYYRLKQVDLNGEWHYSSVILVTVEDENLLTVNILGNNEEDEFLTLEILHPDPGKTVIEVIDLSGRMIYSTVNNSRNNRQEIQIPISNISDGLYMLRVIAEGRDPV
ncbi:MAG: S8 family peptidase, partial [Bacteroidetes bacterium]|nr:S8 family peptidase [Bacteroidota bacterium]